MAPFRWHPAFFTAHLPVIMLSPLCVRMRVHLGRLPFREAPEHTAIRTGSRQDTHLSNWLHVLSLQWWIVSLVLKITLQ